MSHANIHPTGGGRPTPPAPTEPTTEAGQFLRNGLEALGFSEEEANEAILAIEAEARAPALDVEALKEAMIEAGLGVPYHDADPIEREHAEEVAYLYAARLTAAGEQTEDEALHEILRATADRYDGTNWRETFKSVE